MKKKNLLSKAEMKKILGGNALPGSCSTGCEAGEFACCMSGETVSCKCILDSAPVSPNCTSGGRGSSSCSVSND